MSVQSPYAILFEPVTIGPVTARNRFYQVPHCCGMGHLRPQAHAAMRAMKAEGGWAVVSTEETEIHPSTDLSPYPEQRLWDSHDVKALSLMTDAVHQHGALAAVELAHNAHHAMNLYSRLPALSVSAIPIDIDYPKQARAMTKADFKALRHWHRAAALRARDAGFDIVYVYAGHLMTLTQFLLLSRYNDRTDEYGGSLENRVRLLKELLIDTREAIGDTCAVALRFAVDEMSGCNGMQADQEGREVVELLADLPDLWDVNVSGWPNDSATARFVPDEGYQTDYIRFVKTVTNKPVVSVGRLTSPDRMVSLVKQGIIDFIGAARPSIADPFMPNKIAEDRIDDIRECIGCNICVASDNLGVPIRCTQNPTMGEEWRSNWHPEKISPVTDKSEVLIVGAGGAGLECALQLAKRGCQVMLTDARETPGGRITDESALPGLASWRRVSDYRLYQLNKLPNVSIHLGHAVTAADIDELNSSTVFIATGSHWCRDGIGRTHRKPINGLTNISVLSPDDVMAGRVPEQGSVVVYDDECGYMGGVLAEHLRLLGLQVSLVTPANQVSPWTVNTLEQQRVQARLIELGVGLHLNRTIDHICANGDLQLACTYTQATLPLPCVTLIPVTMRISDTTLYDHLIEDQFTTYEHHHLELIGDALAPGLIADAVYSGHRAAQLLGCDDGTRQALEYRRELPGQLFST